MGESYSSQGRRKKEKERKGSGMLIGSLIEWAGSFTHTGTNRGLLADRAGEKRSWGEKKVRGGGGKL